MSVSSIQGQLLEVSVTSCTKLKNTEWISRQDPYVSLEYGSTKYRTRTHTDGGTNPVFQEKFIFTLIEGLKVLKVAVWNSNTMKRDDFIGDGMIHLQKVLSQGFDETSWPLHSQTGRNAGEVRLMMRYSQAKKSETSYSTSAPESAHTTSFYQSPSPYPVYPHAAAGYPYHPTQLAAYPPPYGPPPPSTYPPYAAPPPSAYPPYAPPPSPYHAYAPPPSPYHAYAPPPSACPPPYQYTDPSYYSTGPYRGTYPP